MKKRMSFPLGQSPGQVKATERALREVPGSPHSLSCHGAGPLSPSAPRHFSLSFAHSTPLLVGHRAPEIELVKNAMDQTLQLVLLALMRM